VKSNFFFKSPRNILIITSSILFISHFLPIIKIGNNNCNLLSPLLKGQVAFSLILSGYLLSIILLFKKRINFDYLSRLIYITTYSIMCYTLYIHIPDSLLQKNSYIVFPYIIFPIFNILIYTPVISSQIESSKNLWGIWRSFSSLTGNKNLIISSAKILNLSINEGFGYKTTSASGDIKGYHVQIKENIFCDAIAIRTPYTQINLRSKELNLPFAIFSLNDLNVFGNHPAIPDIHYKKQRKIQFRLLKFVLSYPIHKVGKIRIYTDKKNISQYCGLVTNNPDIDKIFKRTIGFPPILITEGDKISLNIGYSPITGFFGLSYNANNISNIIDTLIKLAENLKNLK